MHIGRDKDQPQRGADPLRQADIGRESFKLPDGKAIIPGVIAHASNIVEHPELIAEWLIRFAKLVGRDNVIAGADCGFSSLACYHTEVHPTVIWAKFAALAEGAQIASRALWGRAVPRRDQACRAGVNRAA